MNTEVVWPIQYRVSLLVLVCGLLTLGMRPCTYVPDRSARVNEIPLCNWEVVEKSSHSYPPDISHKNSREVMI
jgi:hypothetical protein